jgi:SPP1 gp7 family putative phage head morphogenesis protein
MQEMAAFSLRLVQDVEKAVDDFAAQPAAKKIVENSADHGIAWATKSIPNAPKTDAKPFYLAPERRMLELAQKNTFSEIKNLSGDVATRLSRTLVEGYSKGEPMNKLIKRVKDATDFSRNRAITIARTETLRVGNQAAVERFKAYGVEEVEFVAALDDRVCEECERLHGNVYEMGKEPDLPIHPNCRCTYVAYYKTDERGDEWEPKEEPTSRAPSDNMEPVRVR